MRATASIKHAVVVLSTVAAGVVAGCATTTKAPMPDVTRSGTGIISSVVVVPAGYDTVYLSGMTGTLSPPEGSPPGTPGPESGNTETQALRALEKIKAALAEQHLTCGDVVMMHAYLSPDPAMGHADFAGWTAAYTKYFGSADQPNKPSRSTITLTLGSPQTRIEIETIAVRKPKA